MDNVISVLMRDHRQPRYPDPPGKPAVPVLAISTASNTATLGDIAVDAEVVAVDVVATTPESYTGRHVVPLSDLADGLERLAGPLIESGEQVGDPLVGHGALWLRDAGAYEKAGIEFGSALQWRLDGADIPGATGLIHTPTSPGSYTLVETVPLVAGGTLTVTTDPITHATAPGAPAAPIVSTPSPETVRVAVQPVPSTLVNGAVITAYRVRFAATPDLATILHAVTVPVADIGTPIDVTGISGTVYIDTIALSDVGDSAASPAASVTVAPAATIPPQPAASAMTITGGTDPAISLPGPFEDGGSPILSWEMQAAPADDPTFAAIAWTLSVTDIGLPGDPVVWPITGLPTGGYHARVRTANALGTSVWSLPTGSIEVVRAAEMEIVANGNGDVTFTLDVVDDSLAVDVVDTDPYDFTGTYTVSLSDLADGYNVLAGPVAGPEDGASIGDPDNGIITAYGSLIAYRQDLYAAATIDFVTTGQWHRDGTPLGTAFQITGGPLSYTPDLLGSYTLVETIPDLLGGTQTVTSPAVIARGAFELTAEPMDGRWIDLGGIIEDSRRLVVVALLDDAISRGTQYFWTNDVDSNLLSNVYFWASTGTGPRAKFSDPANTYGGTVASSGILDAARRPCMVIQVGDLDRDASNRVTNIRMASPLDDKAVSAMSTATPPALPVDLSQFAFNRGDNVGGLRLAAGTKLRFLWVASVVPNPTGNLGDVSAAVRDALMIVGGTKPNLTLSPRPVNANGILTINGTEVVPEIFLRGPQLGQYDAGGGVKKLTNYGSGADPILNGDYFP